MGELKKRYFTKIAGWILAFMLALTAVPAKAFAAGAGGGITVYMTVSDKGVIAKTRDGQAMAWKEVTVTDLDADGKYSYDEAIKAAHAAYHSADGYAAKSSGWVTSLWGVKDNPAGYYFTKNGKNTDVVTTTFVEEGDYLTAAISSDVTLYSDWACAFDSPRKTTVVGDPLDLTVNGFVGMTLQSPTPSKNTSIGVWEDGKVSPLGQTDANGKATVSFDKAGTHIVTAYGTVAASFNAAETYTLMEVVNDKNKKTAYGKMDWSTYDSWVGYTEKDYGDGPYPYSEIKWMDVINEFNADTFTGGYLLYSGNITYDCPVIAPCCIVTVEPKPIDGAEVSVASAVYTGEELKPELTVKVGEKVLQADVDYTAEYSDNVNPGDQAQVVITGKDNYTGTVTKSFTIDKANIADADVSLPKAVYYSGEPQMPEPVIKMGPRTLEKDTDYQLVYENNTEIGQATIKVSGKGNYEGDKDLSFEIVLKSVEDAVISGLKDKVYTGKALEQNLTLKFGDDTMVAGTDYVLSYKNNIKVGTATVTITGQGLYTGTVDKTFKIKKQSQTLTTKNKKIALKAKKLKKKSQAIPAAKVKKGNKAKTAISYKLVKVNKNKFKKYFKVGKSGKIIVKKKLKKGTYKLKIKASAAASAIYNAAAKNFIVTIKVK